MGSRVYGQALGQVTPGRGELVEGECAAVLTPRLRLRDLKVAMQASAIALS